MKKILYFHAFLLSAIAGYSQPVIRGIVTDTRSRQPLESASVAEAGDPGAPGSRTLTDSYGKFYLKLKHGTARLRVSYVGFKQECITVNGGDSLAIELQPDVVNLKDALVLQPSSFAQFSTLSRVDPDLKPVRSTQELLRLVPGLFLAQHAGGGKAEQIFLRGFDCDHGTDIEISVDGLPVNMVSHAHGQGYADMHFIIPETINSIDFGAGPYYTPHGNLNTAGYTAFSSYTSLPQSRVQVEAGRYNTFRTLALIDLLRKNKDSQTAYLAGDLSYTDGPSVNPQHFSRYNLFGKYNQFINGLTQLTASVSAFKSKWNASGQVPTRAVEKGLISRFGSIDPSEGGNTARYNINIHLVRRLSDVTVWENQAYYSRYIFNLYSNFSFFLTDTVNGDEIDQREMRNLYGYTSRLTHNAHAGKAALHTIYSAGIRYDAIGNSELAHMVRRKYISESKRADMREANVFGYVQEQVASGKWLIDGGIRLDYLHFNLIDKLHAGQAAQGKTTMSPKLSVQYTLNPALRIYFKAGKGFHSNDTRVILAQGGKEILPAAYGADLGISIKPGKRLLLNAVAWYLYLQQEFVYKGDDGNVEPSGRTRREGIDLIMRYQFNGHLFANIIMNLTRPRALDAAKGTDYIPLAPVASSMGGLFYKAKENWNGSLSWRYMKSRPANEDNSIVAKGYFVLDGAVNYTRPGFELGLAIENMLNNDWNEAQFATLSRLRGEPAPVTDLNFTPGIPLFARLKLAVFF